MTSEPPVMSYDWHFVGLEDIRKKWGMLVFVGVLLVLLGVVAIGGAVSVTLATMLFIGGVLVVAGILQTLHAFLLRRWAGFYVEMLTGILNTIVGVMIMSHPGATAVALTLIISLLLILGGVFRILTGFSVGFQNRNWLILHGAINLFLAYSILAEWPVSGQWVIGLFIGIDLLFNGWSLIMMGLALRQGQPR